MRVRCRARPGQKPGRDVGTCARDVSRTKSIPHMSVKTIRVIRRDRLRIVAIRPIPKRMANAAGNATSYMASDIRHTDGSVRTATNTRSTAAICAVARASTPRVRYTQQRLPHAHGGSAHVRSAAVSGRCEVPVGQDGGIPVARAAFGLPSAASHQGPPLRWVVRSWDGRPVGSCQ